MIPKQKISAIENYWNENYNYYSKILEFNKNILKKGKHLDFGCGIGYFGKLLAERWLDLKIIGIDVDQEAIKFSISKYGLKNLNFSTSNKISGRYNSISAFLVLHELKGNLHKQLESFYFHLLPGGKLLIYDFRKRSREKFRKNYDRNQDPYKGSFEEEYSEHNKWNLKEFEELCKKAGFKTVFIKNSKDFWFAYVGEKRR